MRGHREIFRHTGHFGMSSIQLILACNRNCPIFKRIREENMLKTYTITEFLLWHCLLFFKTCPNFYYQEFSQNEKKVPGNLNRKQYRKEIRCELQFLLEDQAFKCTKTQNTKCFLCLLLNITGLNQILPSRLQYTTWTIPILYPVLDI